jgi:Flp pilus assembly pilin Flp
MAKCLYIISERKEEMDMVKLFNQFCIKAYFGVKNFIQEEKGAVDLITIVVLIGIVVILAVAFKKAITNLLTTAFSNITQNTREATTGTVDFGTGG